MRLPYLMMIAASTLSVHQDPVAASAGSDFALAGGISLGLLHLAVADTSVSDQSLYFRGNDANAAKEERGFADVVQQLVAKNLVNKMIKTNSFSALDKVDDLAKLEKISAATDSHLVSAFKVADDANMNPRDLAIELKKIPDADDVLIAKAVQMYATYLAK